MMSAHVVRGMRIAALMILAQACSGELHREDPVKIGTAKSALEPDEEPERCSTPPRDEDYWKAFNEEPTDAKPLDPTLTRTQLDVDDPKVVDALNSVSRAAVEPLKLPQIPGELAKQLDEAAARLAKLADVKDDKEYGAKKDEIYTPLDLDIVTHRVDPRYIDELGLPGYPLEDVIRPPNWPELIPPAFTDLRVRPSACAEYVDAAAERDRLRVYRNIELSQAHVEKICLDRGATLRIETSHLAATVDTAIYLWDPLRRRAVRTNDDAVRGDRASRIEYVNDADSRRCVSAIVLNQRPLIGGTARVRTEVRAGGTLVREKELEVQLRSFPVDIHYGVADVDFEVAITRYTDLPKTPTTLPLALFGGTDLVGFDYDSGVGPAGKVRRVQLEGLRPTRALVLGRSVEARDLTFTTAYLDPEVASAFQPVNPFIGELFVDPPPRLDPEVFPPSTNPQAPPVGFAPIAPGGRVDLVLDEVTGTPRDGDGDGMSAETEAQLCTCDPWSRENNPPGWYAYCDERSAHARSAPNETRWFADTDHDGLTDREEIFGVELDQDPRSYPAPEAVFRTMALPVMGADPLHKDLFLEMDWNMNPEHPDAHIFQSAATRLLSETTGAPRPTARNIFRGEFFSEIDRLFIAGARADLRNPSGLDGIRVHIDVGSSPLLTDAGRDAHCAFVCSSDTACLATCSASVDRERFLYRHRVFGDWGGGGTRIPSNGNDPTTEEGARAIARFCEVVGPRYPAFCGPGADGSGLALRDLAYTSNDFFNQHRQRYFRYGVIGPYRSSGGQAKHAQFGAGLGPYTIAHETGHTLGLSHGGHRRWGPELNCKPHYFSQMNYAYDYQPEIGFSSANEATSAVLDPSNAREHDFFVSGLTPAARTLMTREFRYEADISRLDAAGNGLANIDWNMTRSYETGAVRAPATWCKGVGDGLDMNAQTLMERPEDATGGATPDLVRVGDRLYAFYIDQVGRVQYRHGVLGPKSRGSCVSQRIDGTCLSWSDAVTFPTPRGARNIAIERWDDRIVIAYTDQSLSWPGMCTQHIAYSGPIGADGAVASWSDSGHGRLVQCRDVELAMLPVDPAIAPSGKIMSLFSVSWDDQIVWTKSTSPLSPGTWTEDRARDAAGATLEAPMAPTVAVWPARDYESLGSADWNARATACALFSETVTPGDPGSDLREHLYCLDRATARWTRSAGFTPFLTKAKPALAVHLLRRPNGEPVDGTNLPGQLWAGAVNRLNGWIHVSSKIDRVTPPTSSSVRIEGAGAHVREPMPGSGFVLYEELALGALKAMANRRSGYDFYPLSDGSFEAELKTGNDFQVMEANLCRKLRSSEPHCQGDAFTPFGY